MKSLIKAEIEKLITTRMLFGLLAGAIAISVMAVLGPGEQAIEELKHPFHEQQWVPITAMLMRLLLFVLGVRAITDEFRHGTITSTLLVEPRRERVIAAKVAALAAVGLVFAAIAEGALILAVASMGALKQTPLQIGVQDLPTIFGAIGAGALWAVVGLGVGTILRSQIAPIAGGLVWLMGVEDVLSQRLDDFGAYLPGQAGMAMAISPSTEVLWTSGLTLSVYAVVAWVAAMRVMRWRDVS